MKTYSEQEVFSQTDLLLYYEAKRIVDVLPRLDNGGEYVRCHELARVVAGRIAWEIGKELEVVDGMYEVGAEHSWCMTPDGHILDVYAVGRMPPVQLVARTLTMPNRYTERDIGLKVRDDVVDWMHGLLHWRLHHGRQKRK
jgi:hypothetical protein